MQKGQLKSLLASLNTAQREAVEAPQGPVLVLAGAGSGKTRVLTNRIAWLLANNMSPPDGILAVTFTNKAAGEMRERLEKLGSNPAAGWIGTFHSIGARILRKEGHHLGIERSFNIYDTDDQASCVKIILKGLNLPADKFTPRSILYQISNAKNAFVSPEQYEQMASNEIETISAQVYRRYQKMLRENNATDFDDLLMLPVKLFQQAPNVLEFYQRKFSNVLVDEFQDTNHAQYLQLKLLTQLHKSLFVVGDDDQSIYRWRGADLRNILNFNKDFPESRTYRLEQNYRSTKTILAAAHSVIVNNHGRHEKELWTEREQGDQIQVLEAGTDFEEAEFVVEKIKNEFLKSNRNFRDFAILYRTNSQSRSIEEALRRNSIAYIIIGGLRFYERKEIKDVLAYMKLVANPVDTISLRRVINYPARGIGEGTMQKLSDFALDHGISLFQALGHVGEIAGITTRARSGIKRFHELIQKYISLKEKISLTEWVTSLVEETGILQGYKEEGTPDAQARFDNIRELLDAVYDYVARAQDASLEEYLEQVSLVADIDSWDDRHNAVTLMTLHSAKGLEFPVVHLAGLEEGLFPLSRSLDNRDDLEEERRLFYVGATRAMEKLYISWCSMRRRFGETRESLPSRFLRELDPDLVEHQSVRRNFTTPAGIARRQRRYRQQARQTAPADEDYSQEVPEIQPGTRVQHPKFGEGRIRDVSGRGQNTKVVVDFDSFGSKTLMVYYANLQFL